mgnify:CR=1 FL=1|tara:strand:+ start:2708 stop:2959 length:252 start_codon:yes stop_codon:yes gene_type:complete
MTEKETFGSLMASEYDIGDIVGWTTWDKEQESWILNYGILINIENQFLSNRLVSVATVKSLNEPHELKEMFTISLKLVNKLKK